MSVVSNVIVVCSLSDKEAVGEVQAWLAATGWAPLADVSLHASGNKAMECYVLCGAYNFFDDDAFLGFIPKAGWRLPENLVVALEPQEGPTRLVQVSCGKETRSG